jgi:hypothetical protein
LTNSEFKKNDRMKNVFTTLSAFALLASANVQAQTFVASQVQFWVGSGPDSTVLVIDFQDSTEHPSMAWGFLHGTGATAEDMLMAVDAADINLTVDVTGGFLNSITYGSHAGIGGSPNWWSTWSGNSLEDLATNMGISEELGNGSWFGCSYTDFNPALPPTVPIAAMDPLAFTADDITYWVGTGTDTALLVVDFQDGSGSSSFAWGYLFNGTATAETMVNDIAAADPELAVVATGGFLSDVTYGAFAGIGGSPNYWSTWSATNLGNWAMNLGLSTGLANGDLFGCSYTDFNPALPPGTPVAASPSTGIAEGGVARMSFFPQPATDVLHISGAAGHRPVEVLDLSGKRVYQGTIAGPEATIDVRDWPAGLYVVRAGEARSAIAVH